MLSLTNHAEGASVRDALEESGISGDRSYQSFADFYPYYLHEHSHRVCRALHYVGTTLGFAIMVYAIATSRYLLIPVAIVCGYAFAWVGHFFFEKNKPATFNHPFWSFIGDWMMLRDFVTGRLRSIHPAIDRAGDSTAQKGAGRPE